MLGAVILCSLMAKALACGGLFCDPNQHVVHSGEAIIFGLKNNTVSMHIRINYEGPAEEFGWLIPVMHWPTLRTGSDPFFMSMFQETVPTFTLNFPFGERNCPSTPDGDEAQPRCGPGGGSTGGDVQVGEGSVGPFQYQLIEGETQQILEWLSANGYEQYVGSEDIIESYSGFYFVALQLRKDFDVGDIVPIVIEYDLQEGVDEFAYIPIVLTSMAVTDTLPIQVYILGEARADPINFYRLELDDATVNWVNCRGPACYYQDYQNRAKEAFSTVQDHAFLVEYAGPSRITEGKIAFEIDVDNLSTLENPLDFLTALSDAGVPSFHLLDQILNKYLIPNGDPACDSFYDSDSLFMTKICLEGVGPIDAKALSSELNVRVFEPAQQAENYTESFSYLTRLYVDISRENMNRDPFFRFRPVGELPDVSHLHTANATPICDDLADESSPWAQMPTGLEITLQDGRSYEVKASFGCGMWFASDPLVGDGVSAASNIVVPAYGDQTEDLFVPRSSDGLFDETSLLATEALLRDRVLVTPLVANITESPTSPPSATPASIPVATPVEIPVPVPVQIPVTFMPNSTEDDAVDIPVDSPAEEEDSVGMPVDNPSEKDEDGIPADSPSVADAGSISPSAADLAGTPIGDSSVINISLTVGPTGDVSGEELVGTTASDLTSSSTHAPGWGRLFVLVAMVCACVG